MILSGKKISRQKARQIYTSLALPRLIEEKMLNLLRQNKISKWFSGIGQEAIATGVTLIADKDDYILPMHRNLGVFTTRKVPFYPLFCQLFGKADGFTGGRERSFHFGLTDFKISGMISHLAATMPIAAGLALAIKLKNEKQVVFSFCGDGATSEGDFHEALNLAAVWKLPVVFVIENNGYGLSTPVSEQYACENLVDKAIGYGMEGMLIDGNNIFEVMEATEKARKLALDGKPVLIEAKTFRMRGHEEASGTFYVPDVLFKDWSEKDPIKRLEEWLIHEKIFNNEELLNLKKDLKKSFEADLIKALNAPKPIFVKEKELNDAGFIPFTPSANMNINGTSSEKRFIDGIQLALRQAFREDDQCVIMGQDIAEYGGAFKVTDKFVEEFGKERVRNTPIIESGVIGAAIGLAMEGFKPVVEMQFADFISCGYNQIVNNLSKGRYRWMPALNVTIRCPHGAGVGAGPFHSQSPEGWFMQHPGLRILVPGTVEDAQNMTYTALFDPNPVLIFEHKKLYRSLKEVTADTCSFTDLNKAAIRKTGNDASIITYGMGVTWAMELADIYAKKGIDLEVVDLRTLAPIDIDTVKRSVIKTGRILLLQEPSQTMGPMSEISSLISEACFEFLDAPVMRCSSLDMPIPFSTELEKHYLADGRLEDQLQKLLEY